MKETTGNFLLRRRQVPSMYKIAIFLLLTSGCIQAQETAERLSLQTVASTAAMAEPDGSPSPTQTPPVVSSQNEKSRWFVQIGTIGVVGAIYHSSATISTGGAVIPGASALVSNNTTVTFDVGRDITKNISLQLMVGVPPKPTITGEGAVASLGELGGVRYGPAILTGLYRVRRFGAFQPYAGTGPAYAIILKDHNASVSDLHVRNNFGFVIQGGAEFKLSRKWSLFGDFKEIWLAVNAHGLIDGVAPVTAHVKLNPSLVSAGVKYRF
jgi:outer membrane protein